MIRHIVFFSARDRGRLAEIEAGLAVLKDIPHARRLEIARNAKHDRLSGEVDLVVYGEFDDLGSLDLFKEHPLYQRSIELVRPLRELRIAADYDAAMS